MKLFIVLSVIAYGYADKLDRTYLPPAGAATAGGSPGALSAPGSESAFGQGLPTTSGSRPGTAGFTTSGSTNFGQGPSLSGSNGFGSSNIGASSGNGFSFPKTGSFGQGLPSTSGSQPGATGLTQPGISAFGQRPSGVAQPGSNGFGQGPSGVIQSGSNGFGQGPSGVTQPGSNGFGQRPSSVTQPGSNGFGQGPTGVTQNGFGSSNIGTPSGNEYGVSKTSAAPSTSYSSVPGSASSFAASGFPSTQSTANQPGISQVATGSFNKGYEQGVSGQNFAQAYTPERPQAAADRNSEILKYVNENNIESYNYSYETSNGISAEEAGEATNGVRAQGAYSYTGDDGNKYSVTYTADENGYQPQGEHLPTPHPIPEEILKSIEENARAAAAGTQEGAYRPEEYESDASQPQFNTGITGYNQPEGQSLGKGQGYPSGPSQIGNRPGGSQFSASQGPSNQGRPSGQAGLTGQSSLSGQSGLPSQSSQSGQFGQGSQLSQNNQGQGQDANGYKYNQPQSAFGPTAPAQSPSSQYRPQNGQGQTSYSTGPSASGSVPTNTQGTSLFGNGRPNVPTFGTSQSQYQAGLGQPSGNKPGGLISSSNQGQSPFGSKQTSFGNAQNQYQAGLGQPSGSQQGGVNTSPNQVLSPFGSKQPSFGSPSSFGTPQFGPGNGAPQGGNAQISGSFSGQGNKNQYANKPVGGSNIGNGQTSFTGNQNSQASIPSSRPQFQQSGNQPSFGSNVGPNQGSVGAGTSGQVGSRGSQPIQAPYEYNRPSQGFGSQPQASGLNNAGPQGSNGRPSQGSQGGGEQFGGPRQPPSFSQQEGYKY